MFARFCVAVVSLFSPSIATAHEFWIDIHDYQVATEQNIVGDLVVGQGYRGAKFAYIPAQFEQFDLVHASGSVKVKSRIGDKPALDQAVSQDGLWVVVHETTDFRLTYNEPGVFEDFVAHEGLTGTLEAHAARGLPALGFVENYRRFAKALVAVGDGEGVDQNMGLRTEIIALTNPYANDYAGQMQVQVLFEDAPRQGVQLEVFERAPDGQIRTSIQTTDDQGKARFATKAGHTYMADSVTMLPLEAEDPTRQAVWLSLWASLTFADPR